MPTPLYVQVQKDENAATAVPTEWRGTIAWIVSQFAAGNFELAAPPPNVKSSSPQDAIRFRAAVADYGDTLVALPESTWASSQAQWMIGSWDVVVDLYTAEAGRSDLALFLQVHELVDGYTFDVDSIHVP